MMREGKQIWLITGVSGGLGRALALAASQAGHTVYGTVRRENDAISYSSISPGNTIPVMLDVNDHAALAQEVEDILSREGRLDVLVNNAGYGLFGAVEETSMEEARAQMETNFFGLMAMTKAVLPAMRRQGSGFIVQVSSIAGFRGTNGLSVYNASKFAVEGFSEALAQEMAPFGVKVMLVEPGPFRTNWAGSSAVRTGLVMPEYAETAGARIAQIEGYSGSQPGDPAKAALAILHAMAHENPPLHLPLGALAIAGFKAKMEALSAEIDAWEWLGTDTAYTEGE